jgi:signal transduction histidine kinase
MRGLRGVALATTLVAGAATVAFVLLPPIHLGDEWRSARLALETAGSLIALVAAFLVYGRMRRNTNLGEVLLASAFAVLSVSNLFFVAVPTIAGWSPDDLTVWVAPIARSLGALLFALSAFIPRRQLDRSGRIAAVAVGAVIGTLGITTLFVHTFSQQWPRNLAATVTPNVLTQVAFRTHPLVFAFELLVSLLYGLATFGFIRRYRRFGDKFLGWVAVGGILAVASHVNYSLFPSLYSQSVLFTGDLFRFAFYVALLLACMREIWSYWVALSEAAVLEERRRIACDLHDGLAQELAYLSRNLGQVADDPDPEVVTRLHQAVERAQVESRRAISALAPSTSQAVDVALEEAAGQVAERFRIGLHLDLVRGIRLSPTRAEAVVRIACEAITNAARHSGAESVALRLERAGSEISLLVADTGRGFDTHTRADGFGLISMRERARAVGGELRVRSAPGRGSEVRLRV